MFSLAVVALASAWLVGAQEKDNPVYHPHAAFAFIRTGDRTPTLQRGHPSLTALGAQQMFQLGQNFRTRYVAGNAPDGLGVERIQGMSPNVLNNDQVQVQTLNSPHLVSSAQAFMQGLYPPQNIGNGTRGASGSLLSNGTALDYPMGGYQYANIETSSLNDPRSIYVAGTQGCPMAQSDAMKYFTTEKFMATKTANADFYSKLDIDWFQGNLKKEQLDFTYALEINDYLQYQYTHNSTVYKALSNDSALAGTLHKVRALADEEAYYIYANTSTSDTDSDNQAIAGKTLASMLLAQFRILIKDRMSPGNKSDSSYPLTFLFGEQEPLMSLISLIKADTHGKSLRNIPPFGSAVIFELYSGGRSSDFPTNMEDLRVRFYFHNGTTYENNQLIAFPIFGDGPSRTDMPWSEFSSNLNKIVIPTVMDWCNTCSSYSVFCTGVDAKSPSSTLPSSQRNKHQAVSPAVGGVIGAIVTLVIAGLLFGLAMLLGGIRFHRVSRTPKSELGGFKGSAKLASDPDVSIVKNATPPAGISFVPDGKRGHERVGSWELRQKEYGGDLGERRESFDGIDSVAAKPVQPDERV